MSQYQSFPDAAGDSRTLEKLKLLRLPSLAGKRFLDVGCNEGFFCGYAAFDGASRSVGLDASALFVTRARQRFPGCEFLQQDWQHVPEGPFDVILLASALHYADDQPALVERLVERLAPDGVLVLELGIISSPEAKWVKVKRGIDERFFPTMAKVREMLAGYAWKWLGPSVQQDGDPVARHVIHVSRLRPVAYLMMQPPSYGKSTIAKSLFARAGVTVVAGDEVVRRIATGEQDAPAGLRDAVRADYSPFRIDETVRTLFADGHAQALVAAWLDEAGPGDFALDAYVPESAHAGVEDALRRAGYMPVAMRWDRVGAPLPSADDAGRQATAYYRALAGGDGTAPAPGAAPRMAGTGFVDDASMVGDRLILRGWAVSADGILPRLLQVRVGACKHLVETFERQNRPDVQRHLGLADPRCGYVASVPLATAGADPELLEGLEVRAGDTAAALGPPLAFSAPLLRRLQAGKP
ncbi:MAG TPA: class I SAM-dependent methyltransferase [Xanthomonadaceae bacterium]|jgi:ubiquinone/menaquinone biosynthesis C-methylase UbiE|nr:class I SAM-dependent methyltransferase [Xanthomonadaceae bacterium]